ncbi:MAG: hypothetical protein EP329_05315, partial [Deltaproteobacteria bacterium]
MTLGWAARCASTLVALGGLVAGCVAAEGPEAGGRVAISVAPLSLTGLTDATYTITVTNSAAETVWSRTVTSSSYGDGAGSISYVGPCDADASPNTIALVLDSLSTAGGDLTPGVDYMNPAPAGDAVTLVRPCVADADTAVTFDLTVVRAAQQGFFDIGVTFDDIFCSAKLDCVKAGAGGDEPLTLLSNPQTGVREQTIVLGFACTAGESQDTWLYMNDIVVTCGATSFTVDPGAGPGQLDPSYVDPAADLLFQAAVYRGTEQLGAYSKGYWNVALGLSTDAFGPLDPCTLTATATASNGPLTGLSTPDGTRYPYVSWTVPLTDAADALVCTRHALDGGTEVVTTYSPTTGVSFAAEWQVGASAPVIPAGPSVPGWYEMPLTGGGVLYDGVAPNTVWASEADVQRGYEAVVLARDFTGDFELIASWGHDYPGFGIVHGPAVSYLDVTGWSGDPNGPYWGALSTTGFPSGYAGTYLGQYLYGEKGTNTAVWWHRWVRTGDTVSISYSSTSAAGPWTEVGGSPFTVPATDVVVVGIGEASNGESAPLRIVYYAEDGVAAATSQAFFDPTGASQSFVVPAGVNSVHARMWGAAGGASTGGADGGWG